MPSVFKYNGNEIIDSSGKLGASTMDANQACVKTALNATGDTPIYACRAWVNFNGTGTVSIRNSGNVSSITDSGTGKYVVNFTTAMPDVDYALSGSAASNLTTSGVYQCHPWNKDASSCWVWTGWQGSGSDQAYVTVSVFR